MANLIHDVDWESYSSGADFQSTKTPLLVQIGLAGSISSSNPASTAQSSGATTPELPQNNRPFLEIDISSLGAGPAPKSKICAAWAILLASHSHKTDISIRVINQPDFGDAGGEVNLFLQWNQQVHDLVCHIEDRLSKVLAETALAPTAEGTLPGPCDQAKLQETLQVVIPAAQTELPDLVFSCSTQSGRIHIEFNGEHGPEDTACAHIFSQYENAIRQMCSPGGGEKGLVDLKVISFKELSQVWTWNAQDPPAVEDVCIHQIFMDRAQRHPDLPAVAAHDGQLTYRGLDDLSTRLAHALLHRGIQPKDTLIIFIEKSMWVPVAQLAIMKCGCASVVLDVSLPSQRHDALGRQVAAAGVLTSPAYEKQAAALGLGVTYITLSDGASRSWPGLESSVLPEVAGSDTLYICFTSGSTSTPKGAIISHANYASAVALQQERLDFREFDRVFDFASYAFDAAWCNLIHALTIGGCLCIPSDEERKEDVAGALRKYKVNYAVLTPSVAWFPASELPGSLRTIHFGGEPLKAAMVKEFSSRVTVINAYGPAECSTVSTAVTTSASEDDDPTIGTGLGACTWVVRPDGFDLAALGEIGELWLEGPIVGQGYLHDPEKSAVAFVENPPWLLRGCPDSFESPGHSGRRGRLYRSGDLVRYAPDGSLCFVGRKDFQVKIRGQRVELGEIEHNLQRALSLDAGANNVQIIADVLTPDGSDTPTLVSFVFIGDKRQSQSDSVTAALRQALDGIEERLALLVPPYMIPSVFLPIEDVPMTPTGKIDRRKLREIGSKLYRAALDTTSESGTGEFRSGPQTNLREIWSEVLNLPVQNISLDAVFTRIGGDSISAMQVVSRCRARQMFVSVADIMKYKTIRKIIHSSSTKKPKSAGTDIKADETKPFSLTPMQQLFFDNNPEGVNHFTLSYIVKLVRPTTIAELSAALLSITKRHPMLRTRFRKRSKTLGWEQIIAPSGPESFHLESHVFQDRAAMQLVVDQRQTALDLERGPVFAVDVFDNKDNAQTLLMSAHHVVMDLVSWRILWYELSQYLTGTAPLQSPRISFPTWSLLQRLEGEKLRPQEVLPFDITAADFKYWDVAPDQLYFRDSVLNITHVDTATTSLLLGTSNDSFRTEIQDILLGTLIFCFCQIFPDRKPPTVFLEGHGREVVGGVSDIDLSEIIGWFTTLHPVSFGKPKSSILELIKLAKDTRKRMPAKGRPYFAARYYSEAGKRAFETHKRAEVIFNYRGSFQQLEDANSLIRLEDRPDRDLMVPGDGPAYRRPSLVDINLVIQDGSLQVWTRSHRNMRKHDDIIRWVNLYPETLKMIAHELAGLPPRFTLADFPLLDVSYEGLDTLVLTQIQQMGVAESLVKDIYPCTPMQEGILISSGLDRATYHTVTVWKASAGDQPMSVQRLHEAWNAVSRAHTVFSTIFTTNPDSGRYVQVVLAQPNEAALVQAPGSELAAQHLLQMPQTKVLPSRPECFFTICSGTRGDVACRLEMTHALMDALSLPIIVQDLERAYVGQKLSLESQFCDYISEIQRTPNASLLSYWTNYLSGVVACNISGDLLLNYSPPRTRTRSRWVTLPTNVTAPIAEICQENEITRSVFLHVAWSIVLAYFTGTRQVCFGFISSGRDLPVHGIEQMVGPLINMQIARVDVEKSLASILADVSRYHIEHLDHQHVSLAEIQHEMSSGQLFNTNITVREARKTSTVADSGMRLLEVSEEDPHEYDLVLSATLDKMHTEVSIQYRTEFSTATNAQEIQHALENAIRFLGDALRHKPHAEVPGLALYDAYFSHAFHTDENSALGRWKALLGECDEICHFPAIAGRPPTLAVIESISFAISNLTWRDDFDVSTQILASWALLAASHGSTRDVIVGTRSMNVISPTPMRVVVDFNATASAYLNSVQSSIENYSKLPRLPPQRLRALDNDAALAWDFPAVLSIDEILDENVGLEPDRFGWELAQRISIHFSVAESTIQITSSFDEGTISSSQMTRVLLQFETVMRQLSCPAYASSKLQDIDTISGPDFQQISQWNGSHYDEAQVLVHDLIYKTVKMMPDSLAISSWDGQLTYRQLDNLSTRLAHHLVHLGVGRGEIVPVYSEKSLLVPISIVGIMKAGGAGVMIDCAQPVERINSVFSQVKAMAVLVSTKTAATAARCSGIRLITVDQGFLDKLPHPEQGLSLRSQVSPSDLLYVSFTSGSTGEPKGAMITHTCFSSSIKHQQAALGFKAGCRVYDFASYSFDAAWSNLLHSITSGSCLCIPSEHERQNELPKSIRSSRATLLNITPSVLRHLDPSDLPDIEQVLMGGEAWVEADFLDWIDKTRLINSYGPGECTIKSCLIRAYRGMVPNTLGYGIGLNTWIVRTDGSDRLAPLGSVGELWLEGPQVGRGYIADDAKTAASFVTRPKWMQGTWPHVDGPPSRFYRTGDLVYYNSDGTIVFHGRKDSQVKLRGQRTELGEVERSIQKALVAAGLKAQVAAEVLKPLRGDNPILVAFLLADQVDDHVVQQKLQDIDHQLSDMVPSYMIPTAYITLDEFPMTATGKVHRKAVRETYMTMTLEQISALNALRPSQQTRPTTTTEKTLRALWAAVLKVDEKTIFADSSFLRIGGDSLGAMRLVGLARKQGLVFTVADIFRQPRLDLFAAEIQTQDGTTLSPVLSSVAPFYFLELPQGSVQEATAEAARLCGLEPKYIEDIYPCTPLQAGLLAETVKHPGMYVLTESWHFGEHIDRHRFRCAWQSVIRRNPILRTRIIDLAQHGLVQVVVNFDWYTHVEADEPVEFGLGTPLMLYEISEQLFTWNIHHALYDGWTSPLIFESLARIYREETVPVVTPFQSFLKYLQSLSQVETDDYWKSQFSDFQAQNFPVLPTTSYRPRCDQFLSRDIEYSPTNDGFTVATRIRLAWAVLLATVTNSVDASFGATVSGRQADVPGIEDMMGPTIATVPIRITVNRSSTVQALLETVQSQAVGMVRFEQTGLPHIQRLSEDCKMGCAFQSFLIVQPEARHDSEDFLFDSSTLKSGVDHGDAFNQYAICLTVDLFQDHLRFRIYYDSVVVAPTRMSRLLDRLDGIFQQLSLRENGSKLISDLDTSSATDLKQIWGWNDTIVERSDETIHGIFGRVAAQQPHAPAICSWDGDFTYGQLDQLSTNLAEQLLQASQPPSPDCIVPLYFEKCKWTSVCQLAVMKAGWTSTLLDAELPISRLEVIIGLVNPQLILTSVELEAKARELAPPGARVLAVGESTTTWGSVSSDSRASSLPAVHPDSWIYINFTSGSTGVPKGAIISHSNFASAIKHVSKPLRCYTPQTRTYDYTAYAFDVTWQNILFTLCAGGCLCIPSQYEIHNEPVEAALRRRANHMHMIPSVSKILHGAKLDLVNFGGEKASLGEIKYWVKQGSEVILTYGPAECTPTTTVHPVDPESPRVVIGKATGVRTWIVDESGSKLAAVGDIGELWLEGPVVGQGYLQNPAQTDASFIDKPEWSSDLPGPLHRCYRTGDLVRYEEDGSIEYIGRKDSQIKIRGQRVHLEEIEHHLLNVVKQAGVSQVVADILKPQGSTESALVAFIKPSGQVVVEPGSLEAIEYARDVAKASRRGLAANVPSYMIPNGFIVVGEIPKTGSGKVDRNKLRAAAGVMRKEDILQVSHVGKRTPATPEELTLHSLVAQVLSWDGEPFGMDNDFIQLGGDSISAMRLVSLARSKGMMTLRVADILSKDNLSGILETIHAGAIFGSEEPSPRSRPNAISLGASVSDAITAQISPGHGALVNVLPVTDMQCVYLKDNLFTPRRSWFYSYVDFDEHVDILRLVQSCEKLAELCDIYRTAFIRSGDTFLQAAFASWKPTVRVIRDLQNIEKSLDELAKTELHSPVQLGAPLASFTVLQGRDSAARLVMGMSHAIYDGISRSRTLELLAELYNGSTPQVPDFASFVMHTQSSKADSYDFWRETLQGSPQMTLLPSGASATCKDGPPITMKSTVPMPRQPRGITQASIFTLACAEALHRLTGDPDVVIGRVVSGRAAIPAHLMPVVGPCLNRVPVRVKFDEHGRAKASRLRDLQKQTTESIAHETTGLLDIVRHSTHWPQDTSGFGVWVQYQNIDEKPTLDIAGATAGGLQVKELWDVPVASDFLEVLALPQKGGQLTIKIIAGPGFAREVLEAFLEGICAEIVSTD
ncbi:acetyl-CoA synthetase-like protein [Xylaria longipes]|nr:acetyl-CoA synthetase-like protein [Xylaria longipes]